MIITKIRSRIGEVCALSSCQDITISSRQESPNILRVLQNLHWHTVLTWQYTTCKITCINNTILQSHKCFVPLHLAVYRRKLLCNERTHVGVQLTVAFQKQWRAWPQPNYATANTYRQTVAILKSASKLIRRLALHFYEDSNPWHWRLWNVGSEGGPYAAHSPGSWAYRYEMMCIIWHKPSSHVSKLVSFDSGGKF